MRTLDRYVAAEFIRLFVLFALAAPLLFVLGDWTDRLDTYTERAIPGMRVALSYVYQLPQFILFSLPIASLIATVFTVNNMARHAEMTAAKAGGVSFFRILAVLPVIGILLTGGGLVLSEVVPIALRRAAELTEEPGRGQGSRTTFVYRSADGPIYSVRQLDVAQGRIFGITMDHEGDKQSIPSLRADAREAIYDSTGGWTLMRGHLRVISSDGRHETFAFDSLKPRRFHEKPDQLLIQPREPDEMRYAELAAFIENLRRSGGSPLGLEVQLWGKIAIPVATIVIILFGAPLANAQARGGPAFGIGVSLGITIVYLLLFRLGEAAGEAGTVPPLVAAWFPNALFFLAGLVLLSRTRT
jgi:lipopolysaccharide export system permease protein